jgi:hypothetical protein
VIRPCAHAKAKHALAHDAFEGKSGVVPAGSPLHNRSCNLAIDSATQERLR